MLYKFTYLLTYLHQKITVLDCL